MHGAQRIARVLDAPGQTLGHTQPPFDFPQHQQPAIGGQTAPIEAPDDGLADNG